MTASTTTATPGFAVPGDALGQRLAQVALALLGPDAAATAAVTGGAGLLDALVASVRADRSPDRVWLLLVGLSGAFPDDLAVRRTLRTLATADQTNASLWLLDTAMLAGVEAGTAARPITVVTGGVVADVSHAAGHDLHTGIQRVVRSTLPIWKAAHEVVLVALRPGGTGLRALTPVENDRVLHWSEHVPDAAGTSTDPDGDEGPLVVPWRSTVVTIEVPARDACDRLAALAQWSGNRLVAVGHDCIPVVSALDVPLAEPNRFVHYLTMIKYAAVVAGVSVSATTEFRGFADMLPAQGLPGPQVVECRLPVDGGGKPAEGRPVTAGVPLVLCVGSFEPRKNHLAVLYAAEVLWREGLRFRLRLVGGSQWGHDVVREAHRLARLGRDVEVRQAVSDDELEASYRAARFTVFVSWHEGYGLPLAESLGRGVPALAGDFGSQREIAGQGGALLVDPRDDDAIVDGMRRLITDDTLVEQLRTQIASRPTRTWTDYAEQLWSVFGLPAGEPAATAPVSATGGGS